MFNLIDPPVYEQPIEIDFVAWLKTRNHPAADMPKYGFRIVVMETEWEGVGDRDGKLPYEVDTMTVYRYGNRTFCHTMDAATFLQETHPIALVGVRNDVNNWYNLLNFAKQEAIDWRRAKAK